MATTDTTAAICAGTPTVQVIDNRGRVVRILQYNRTASGAPVDEQINRSLFSDDNCVSSLWDPRFFTLWQSSPEQSPNTSVHTSLSGRALRSDSVDAGWQAALYDIEGHESWSKDSRGTVTRTGFDKLGRPVQVLEQASGAPERVAQRLIYGDCDPTQSNPQDDNLRGQIVRHYDDAGLVILPAFTLQGSPVTNSQRLLADVEQQSDWQGDDETLWKQALSADTYTSATTCDATGAPLTQTDAKGNRQRVDYDVAGVPCRSFMALAGGPEQTLLKNITYSAAGKMLQETAGNDVVTCYTYEPQTQRLVGVKTSRPVSGSRNTILQDLSYQRDPVGNILQIDNAVERIRYFRNQAVAPRNSYTYDALYQLLTASGRENAAAPPQSPVLPSPIDTNNVVNYSRSYTYDRGGNLLRLAHSGAQNYTHTLFVDANSNRALAQDDAGSVTQATIGQYFDARGNVVQMQPTNPLVWNARNQLQWVVLLDRGSPSVQNDREIYQYRGGMRVRKQTRRLTNPDDGRWDVDDVIYLPGLELRTTSTVDADGNAKTSEVLQVATVGVAGRASVRVLHWDSGKPQDIGNDQVRYGLDNEVRSVTLELDSEANILTVEEYYPFGGTAVLGTKSSSETKYKVVRYSGQERDSTGLYYYGYRYYAAWLCRWLNPDPAGGANGANRYCMVRNNPVGYRDAGGAMRISDEDVRFYYKRQNAFIDILKQVNHAFNIVMDEKELQRNTVVRGVIAGVSAIASVGINFGFGALGAIAPDQYDFAVVAAAVKAGDLLGTLSDDIADVHNIHNPHLKVASMESALSGAQAEAENYNMPEKHLYQTPLGFQLLFGTATGKFDQVTGAKVSSMQLENYAAEVSTVFTEIHDIRKGREGISREKATRVMDFLKDEFALHEAVHPDVMATVRQMEAEVPEGKRVKLLGMNMTANKVAVNKCFITKMMQEIEVKSNNPQLYRVHEKFVAQHASRR